LIRRAPDFTLIWMQISNFDPERGAWCFQNGFGAYRTESLPNKERGFMQ